MDRITALEEKIKTLFNHHEKTEKNINNNEDRIQELEKKDVAIQKTIEALEKTLNKLDKIIEGLEKAIQNINLKPLKKYEKILHVIISALIGGIITYFLK